MSGGPSAAPEFGAASRPPKTPRPWPVPRCPGPSPERIAERWGTDAVWPWIDAVGEDDAVETPGVPVREGVRFLRYTFVVEAAGADRVLFWANRLSDETDLSTTLMVPVEGTALWSASFVMPADWRASYCFLTATAGHPAPWEGEGDQIRIRAALDAGRRDERNPSSCRNRAGVVQSLVEGPDAPVLWDSRVTDSGVPEGWRRRDVVVDGRSAAFVEPVDARADDPVLVVLDGEVWDDHHALVAQVAARVAAGDLRPQRLLLVPSGGREERWRSLAGETDGHLAWLVGVLSAATGGLDPALVTLIGQSLGGVTALRGVLSRPDAFGWALSQSASTWLPGVSTTTPAGPVVGGVHLAHGAQEWVLAPGHAECGGVLRSHGVMTKESVHEGGHDYAWWRHALVDGLVWQESVRRGREGRPLAAGDVARSA